MKLAKIPQPRVIVRGAGDYVLRPYRSIVASLFMGQKFIDTSVGSGTIFCMVKPESSVLLSDDESLIMLYKDIQKGGWFDRARALEFDRSVFEAYRQREYTPEGEFYIRTNGVKKRWFNGNKATRKRNGIDEGLQVWYNALDCLPVLQYMLRNTGWEDTGDGMYLGGSVGRRVVCDYDLEGGKYICGDCGYSVRVYE